MIINSQKVKTEALLLICRDIIESYKDQNSTIEFSNDMVEFINNRIDDLLKSLNVVLQPNDYYIRNSGVSRINIILKTHQYLQKNLSSYFTNNQLFDPAMLCFALLSTWFAEFQSSGRKEFIYFTIYPYSEVYDKLLLNIEDKNFKTLNISMLNIAEQVILKLDRYKLR